MNCAGNEEKTINVLIVVTQMNIGGVEKRLLEIIERVERKRVSIDLYTCRMEPGVLDEAAKKNGCKVFYNPPLTFWNMRQYVKQFREFLCKHPEYKIVHIQQNAWCSIFCKGAYQANIPVRIAHSMTALNTLSLKNMIKNIIKIPTRKYATHYFAVSQEAGKWLFGEKNIANGKVKIWKNAIDCEKYRFNEYVRNEMRLKCGLEGKKVLMHVGNFTPPKNHLFLIDILECLLEREKDFHLVLVGGRGTKICEKMRRKIEEKKLAEYVTFLGIRDDVPKLLQAADVFCFPSFYEGLPGAVVEAQAAGLPCVISSSITKEVCILETTKQIQLKASVNNWAEEIIKAANINRRDTFDKMVHAGFDIENLTKNLMNFYETIGREQDAV